MRRASYFKPMGTRPHYVPKHATRSDGMKKILALALIAGMFMPLVGTGAQEKKGKTPEERFKAMDTNNDGKLSKEEFVARFKDDAEKKGKAEMQFGRIDKNNDGFLSLDEYREGTMKKK